MLTKTTNKAERLASERLPGMGEAEPDTGLRALAIERIYRVRRFKLHLVVFAVGIPLLATLWLLTEYFEENTWPSRFASTPTSPAHGTHGCSSSRVSGS